MTLSGDMVRRARGKRPDVPRQPRDGLAVVTCMDARVDPLSILGASLGDLHVIRNAGGIVTGDVLRSLWISQMTMGTNQVTIVMHTDCGLLGLDPARLRDDTFEVTGQTPPFEPEEFDDMYERLARSIEIVRETEFLPHRSLVSGAIYDVETQELSPAR